MQRKPAKAAAAGAIHVDNEVVPCRMIPSLSFRQRQQRDAAFANKRTQRGVRHEEGEVFPTADAPRLFEQAPTAAPARQSTDLPERALQIIAPYASAVVRGVKTWEIRGRATAVRGRIAIAEIRSHNLIGTVAIVDCRLVSRDEFPCTWTSI